MNMQATLIKFSGLFFLLKKEIREHREGTCWEEEGFQREWSRTEGKEEWMSSTRYIHVQKGQ